MHSPKRESPLKSRIWSFPSRWACCRFGGIHWLLSNSLAGCGCWSICATVPAICARSASLGCSACSRSSRVSVCNTGLVPVNANGLLTGARAAAAADAWCMGMPPLLLLLLILLRPAPGAADGRSMHVSRPPLRSLGFSPTSLRHVPKQRPDSLRIPAPRKASAGARLRLGLVLVSAESGNALVPSVPPQSACPPTGRAARRCRRPCSRPRGSHGASQKSPGMDYNTTTFTITVEKHSRSTAISVTLDRTGTAALVR